MTQSFPVPYFPCNPLELSLVGKQVLCLKPYGCEILHEVEIENNTWERGDMELLFQPRSLGFSSARPLLGRKKTLGTRLLLFECSTRYLTTDR